MSSRRKIEHRIFRKEEEIQELEANIREARAYVQALQDVMKLLPRDESVAAVTVLRAGSAAAEAREIILRAGHALHISDILMAMGRELTRKNRSALSGSISAYVRRGQFFTRPEPNTFGLVEFAVQAGDDIFSPVVPPVEISEPPAEFGVDDEESELDQDTPF